jgi:DNA-binding HxlR family transcriptional regulator
MTMMIKDTLPDKAECASSLRNVVDALYVLNGKWKLPVVLNLMHSPKRFNELQNELRGISPKVLASELKHLDLNGFIKRNVSAGTPETIVYEVTEYSWTLKNVLRELSAWGGQHREKIKQSMRE